MHPGIKPGHTFILVDKGGQVIWRWDWPGHGMPMYLGVSGLYQEVARRNEPSVSRNDAASAALVTAPFDLQEMGTLALVEPA